MKVLSINALLDCDLNSYAIWLLKSNESSNTYEYPNCIYIEVYFVPDEKTQQSHTHQENVF